MLQILSIRAYNFWKWELRNEIYPLLYLWLEQKNLSYQAKNNCLLFLKQNIKIIKTKWNTTLTKYFEVIKMMYPYMTLSDETEIIHSQIIKKNGKDYIEVNFEKPIENGFCSARCCLPDYKWLFNKGYADD